MCGMSDDIDIANSPYAEWLEGVVKSVVTMQPDSMGFVAMRESDGMALTAYFGAGVQDKSLMILHLLSDWVMELIENNADTIRDIVLGEEDDKTDDEEDDEEEYGRTHYTD